MSTVSWASRIRHDSDVYFREWGLELSTKLAEAGLVKTTDTGQIDWATAIRGSAPSASGYEIWRMNDAAQATAPVFFRVEYGYHSAVSAPRIRISVGTGTNGAGTLIGTLSTVNAIHGSVGLTSDIGRQSFLCVTEGFFGLSWKIGAGVAEGFFAFSRTVNTETGVPNAIGGICLWGSGSTTGALSASQALRFASVAQAYAVNTSLQATAICFNPQWQMSTTLPNGNSQAFIGWTVTPEVSPLVGLCGVIDAEIVSGTTFTFAALAGVAHTYLTLTRGAGNASAVAPSTNGGLLIAMLWE